MTSTDRGAMFWTDAGKGWVEDDKRVELIGGPLGRLAMDRLDLRPGLRVLDVGCGTGGTTVEIANRMSPGGVAVGVDVSPTMLAAARKRRSAAPAEFVEADAQRMAMTPGSFDRVFSRFGVMFFDDPKRGFVNLRSGLAEGGRLAFVSWLGPEHNEWIALPAAVAATVLGAPVGLPPTNEPGPFSLADPARVAAILQAAGFRVIDVTPHNDLVTFPLSDAMAFAAGSISHGGIRSALRGADDDTERRVRLAIAEQLTTRATDGLVQLARGALVIVASA